MTTPLKLYSVAQAAKVLAPVITEDWLYGHIDEIPHIRSGKGPGRAGRIGFTEQHLIEIVEQLEVRPQLSTPTEQTAPISRRRRPVSPLGRTG